MWNSFGGPVQHYKINTNPLSPNIIIHILLTVSLDSIDYLLGELVSTSRQ